MKETVFFIVILLANIIQGITGFAGTILAMPFGIMLVGYDTARPVLNVLGLLSGIYVFAGNRRSVDKKELGRIVPVMAVGILAGLGIKAMLAGKEKVLYLALGSFVLVLAAWGLYRQLAGTRGRKSSGAAREAVEEPAARGGSLGTARRAVEKLTTREDAHGTVREAAEEPAARGGSLSTARRKAAEFALLAAAGVAHGVFVSGGPLLIGYLTGRIRDKTIFRATISTVWIILNSLILLGDIREGLWTGECLLTLAAAVPFLTGGMFIGGKLYRIMSQKTFMTLTYVLLALSGVLLLCK